ncbi:MAG: nucleotide-binding protein, partial [Acidobacteriaceae bacterium]|nr:nucleotide-binding protein [Acidobacteriaceae bacterium]
MPRPAVFIGSSSEGKKFALAVQTALQADAEITTWNQGTFALGQTFIEGLMEATSRSDFAILMLTPDDIVQSRSAEVASPRDNVIFELGLFMGKLGRDRTFILQQRGSGLKIPTDLAGVVTSHYDWPRADMIHKAAVATASEAIREKIQVLGRRDHSPEDVFLGLDPNLVV